MPMLSVSGLTKRFGALRAVNNVSFDVNEGEILGLIGPNGSGKSTTFNCVAGHYRPDGGAVHFEGSDIAGLPANRVCHKGIGRTFQIPRPFHNLTLLENVALSAFFGRDRGVTQQQAWAYAEEALVLVGLPVDARATTAGLGAAALKKLELARALATQPKLLLLDEVAGGLTEHECVALVALIRDVRQSGVAIIWIEHVVHALIAVVDRLVALAGGTFIAEGEPQAVIRSPAVRDIYMGIPADA